VDRCLERYIRRNIEMPMNTRLGRNQGAMERLLRALGFGLQRISGDMGALLDRILEIGDVFLRYSWNQIPEREIDMLWSMS
jgi:hypothetical protein